MSNVLQRVAAIHRERWSKAEKRRLTTAKKLGTQKAYFKDTGLPEMWDDVKDIVIANPCPDIIEGFTIPLSALVVTTAVENINGTGLRLYDKNESEASWEVLDQSNCDEEHAKLYYHVSAIKNNFCVPHNAENAKKKFVDSFIKWLARYVTPSMLAEMNIEPEPVSVIKRSRKILQLAET
jgi:hypothetical protein